jgi:hypothetical protein
MESLLTLYSALASKRPLKTWFLVLLAFLALGAYTISMLPNILHEVAPIIHAYREEPASSHNGH